MAARTLLAIRQGDFEQAERYLHDLLPDGPGADPADQPHPIPGIAPRAAAELALESGNLLSAREWLTLHDHCLDWSGAVPGRAEGQTLWGQVCLAEADLDKASDYARQAVERARSPRQPMALIGALRLTGIVQMRRGDLDSSASNLSQALELATDCDLPFERALTLMAQAELSAWSGFAESARMSLNAARRIFIELKARPSLARVEEIAAGLQQDRPRSPYGISQREREVLKLLTQGMTDKDIAEALFISRHTVMKHTSSIRTKLQVDSRTAAAAKALREGLV